MWCALPPTWSQIPPLESGTTAVTSDIEAFTSFPVTIAATITYLLRVKFLLDDFAPIEVDFVIRFPVLATLMHIRIRVAVVGAVVDVDAGGLVADDREHDAFRGKLLDYGLDCFDIECNGCLLC